MTPELVIQLAREQLGTPFYHQGRICDKALDCAGLVICVFRQAGLLPLEYDNINYAYRNDGEELETELAKYCDEVLDGEPMVVGDIITMTMFQNPQHCGIVTDIGVIHTLKKVVEHPLDDKWLSKIRKVFRPRYTT